MDGNKNINLENLSDFKKNIDNVIDSLTKSIELPIATTDTLGGIKPDNNTNFVDEDGVLRVVGSLDKIMLVPSTNDNFTYDGTEHSPVWQNYDDNMLSISGETSGTNAGIYTTVFTPKEEYIWGDGVKKAKSVSWNIKCINLTIPAKSGNITYTGIEQSPTWENYDSEKIIIGGTTSATNVGLYTTTFTPKENYQWSDGTNTTKSVDWSIEKATIVLPSQSGTLTYTGVEQSPIWSDYDSDKMTVSDTLNAIKAGSYTATFTPKSNYQWSDGTTISKSVNWCIEKAVIISIPSQSGTLTYSGSEQSPTWNNYNDTKLIISGITSGINAGTYTVTFTPKEGYMWSDSTEESKSVNWTINRASITITPSQNGTLTYTGSAQSPTWSNYDSNKMTISGTTSGTNASSYTATFTPKSNYQWNDGIISSKNVNWSIGKATGSLSLNKTSIALNASTLTATATVTRAGNGAITATSSNTSIATVSVSGTTLTITAKSKGTATITVNVAADTNHNAPESKTVSVTVDMPSTNLTDNTPANIQAAAKNGTASNYWSIGDKIAIKLNGAVGQYTFSNETYYAVILGFNHNSSVEGSNSIHFQFGKDSSGADIAFCDGAYGQQSTTGFIMNTTNVNTGGWNNSYMRKTICPAFLAAMPTEWQNIIVPCTKYSDNTGGGQDTASYVTATSDKIWLLSEFEVQGARTYANSAEKNYQKQYDYFRNGNSKVKYKHLEKSAACRWWCRSVHATSTATSTLSFCYVHTSGTASYLNACYSWGFAPGFKVA